MSDMYIESLLLVNKQMAATIDALRAPVIWKHDDIEGTYTCDCGLCWQFECDGPAENSCKFCPKCGHPIRVVTEAKNA